MTEELKPVLFAGGGHPDETQLLLVLERELPAEDVARVEQHLGNCWNCRARYDEMQRGILAFVEYREKRYLPFLPTPPDDTSSFRQQLRNQIGENAPVPLLARIWRNLISFVELPRQVRWASAVAATTAGVVFWVYVIANPGLVSASELLNRAAMAQNPAAAKGTGVRRRIVHQKMQIRSGNRTVVRDFEWTAGTPGAEAGWAIQPDLLTWKAPMTAEGFAGWRGSLRDKIDTVKRTGDRLTLDTTTSQQPLREAWIVVRAADFHPLEQHLRFANDQQLDFTELAFQIDDDPQPLPQSQPESRPPSALPQAPLPASVPAAPPADLDETELQLRYALYMHQWDLGEDLVIRRDAGQVVLSGIVSSAERKDEMGAALSAVPNVRFSVDLPAAQASALVRTVPTQGAEPLLDGSLNKAFASREERLAFVDRSLSDSDTALSHAWALRRLAERYDDATERLLKPESDQKLSEMLRAHLRELSRANDQLAPLLALVPGSIPAPPAPPANWRAGVLALFAAVQQQDRLVSSLVAGSRTNSQNLATASANIWTAHETIRALLGDLRDLNGAAAIK
jgi:hypothetical protein